jgi:hypothetical protein
MIPEEFFERPASAGVGTEIVQMADEQMCQCDQLEQTLILQCILSQIES